MNFITDQYTFYKDQLNSYTDDPYRDLYHGNFRWLSGTNLNPIFSLYFRLGLTTRLLALYLLARPSRALKDQLIIPTYNSTKIMPFTEERQSVINRPNCHANF